jgi:hypothetical protein
MSKAGKKGQAVVEEVPPEPIAGNGEFVMPDQSRYKGDFLDTAGVKRRHGIGTFSLGSESYTGEWVNDLMTGVGEYNFGSGAVYKGNFKSNLFEGEGTYTFPNGSSYSGVWQNNKMHGSGTYTNADGLVTAGEFVNGVYISGERSGPPQGRSIEA